MTAMVMVSMTAGLSLYYQRVTALPLYFAIVSCIDRLQW